MAYPAHDIDLSPWTGEDVRLTIHRRRYLILRKTTATSAIVAGPNNAGYDEMASRVGVQPDTIRKWAKGHRRCLGTSARVFRMEAEEILQEMESDL